MATGLLPLRAVVVVEDDALGFEDADDIDRGLRVVLAGGFVYLDVDDDRFQIPAFLVEEPLAVGPVGGVGHVVDHLPVQGGADPDTCDRHKLPELLLGELLPELGGEITDTPNVVTFQDDFNVHVSIAAFPMDATQRWEYSTRGVKDYLSYFLDSFVMPDFRRLFPDARIESQKYLPEVMGGALLTYTLLPGGSMFGDQHSVLGTDETPPIAKRGNLIFVRNSTIFIISTELAERVIERSTYQKTTADEDEILRLRLADILKKMEFTRPATEP